VVCTASSVFDGIFKSRRYCSTKLCFGFWGCKSRSSSVNLCIRRLAFLSFWMICQLRLKDVQMHSLHSWCQWLLYGLRLRTTDKMQNEIHLIILRTVYSPGTYYTIDRCAKISYPTNSCSVSHRAIQDSTWLVIWQCCSSRQYLALPYWW
jgi:hypothetical protein